jgi:hypothetical protein
MSYEIALINPRAKSSRRKRASAKQLAARRRFVAKFAKGRKARKAGKSRRVVKSRKSPTSGVSVMAKRRRRRSSSRNAKGHFVKKSHKSRARRVRRKSSGGARRPAQGYTVGTRKIRRRKLNPRVRRRRYRRNPLGLPSVGGMFGQLVPAAYGAGGALALNLGLSYLPLPDMLKTGMARHGVRLVGAFGLGWAARKFLGAKGNAVAAGALTVVMYDILKAVINGVSPEIGSRLGEFEDVSLDGDGDVFIDPASPISAYLEGPDSGDADTDMSAYLEGDMDGVLDGELDGVEL